MISPALYENIIASIVKLAIDFIALEAPEAVYCDWDSHASLSELPKGTLIGPAGCGLTHDDQKIEVVFGLGVGTDDDPNLFLLRSLVSKLFARVQPKTRIQIYDAATAQKVSWMVVTTPVAVTPTSRAEIRAMQFVECRALIDLRAAT
jgi:hypothetical protein